MNAVNDVVIKRNGRLATVIGVLATVVAAAFLVRHHSALDLVLAVVMTLVAGWQLWNVWDARVPLLVADRQGVRVRLGGAWRGLTWQQLEEVEHTPRASWWRDGRLVLLPHDPAAELASLPGSSRRQAMLSTRMYGAPFALPLGLSTAVLGGSSELSSRLADLAAGATTVVEIDPSVDELATYIEVDGEEDPFADAAVDPAVAGLDAPGLSPEPSAEAEEDGHEVEDDPRTATAERPAVRAAPARVVVEDVARLAGQGPATVSTPVVMPVIASATPSPLREPTVAVRAEVARVLPSGPGPDAAQEATEQPDGEPASVPDMEVPAPPRVGDTPETEDELRPAILPVVGPVLAHARENLGLSVDQLAERTRIRAHVIEAIEVDDFGPCGGDFYARGHLRTLARVLGVDAGPLLSDYDELYADAPIDPRRVFEAELAATSTFRRMRGGPNWSVMIAAIMGVVLLWSVTRLVLDAGSHTPAPAVSLSGNTENPYARTAAAVPVTITAAGGGTHVVVRDGAGAVVYTGDLAFGESRTVKAAPPVRIQASDGSATVSVDGGSAGPIGDTGHVAQRTYTGP